MQSLVHGATQLSDRYQKKKIFTYPFWFVLTATQTNFTLFTQMHHKQG
jgi:hypothetical protein